MIEAGFFIIGALVGFAVTALIIFMLISTGDREDHWGRLPYEDGTWPTEKDGKDNGKNTTTRK